MTYSRYNVYYTKLKISEATIVEGFESAEHIIAFLDQVDCTGSETQLSQCANKTTTTTGGDCKSAGVTCVKCSSKNIITVYQYNDYFNI